MKTKVILFLVGGCIAACGAIDEECQLPLKNSNLCIRGVNEDIIPSSKQINLVIDSLNLTVTTRYPSINISYEHVTITFLERHDDSPSDSYNPGSQHIIIYVAIDDSCRSTLYFMAHELIHHLACQNNINCDSSHPQELFGTYKESVWSIVCSDIDDKVTCGN